MKYYVIYDDKKLNDGAYIEYHPDELGLEGFEFGENKPLADRLNSPLIYRMDNSKPDEREVLYSWVKNPMRVPIICPHLAAVLREANPDGLEVIPISIMDRHNNLASEDYFLIHSIHFLDLIDLENSIYRLNPMDKLSFFSWRKLVLKDEKVEGNTDVFSIKGLKTLLFVSEKIKVKVEGDGRISGVGFVELSDFTSLHF